MADVTYVFDPEVFAFMFDLTDVTPSILKVFVPEQHRKIAAGQFVSISIYIVNNISTPGRVFLMDTTVLPRITIYAPDDTIAQAESDMEQIETGIYAYTHTTVSSDPPGPYSALFTAANASNEMVSKKYVIFRII